MFSVRIGGENLNLKKGSKVSLELNNPMFNEELIEGSFTYPFELDMSGHNIRLTNFRNMIQNKRRLEEPIDCYLDIHGNPYKAAKLRLDYSSSERMTGFLQVDSGSVADVLNTRKLAEVNLGGERFIGNNYATKLAHFSSKAPLFGIVDQYCFFPIFHPNFYGQGDDSKNPAFTATSKTVNMFYAGAFLSNPDSFGVGTRLEYSFVPFPSLFYVLKQCCKSLGYVPTGSLFDDLEMQGAVIYNTKAIDRIGPGPDSGLINYHQDNINLVNHVPDLTIGEFFNQLRKYFFINIGIDSSRKTITFTPLREIHRSADYVDWSRGCSRSVEEKSVETSGIKFNWGVDDDDELFELNSFQREYSEGSELGDQKEMGSEASGLFMVSDPYAAPDHKQLIPHALQVGNSLDESYNDPNIDATYLGQNNFTFRVLFYRGRQPDSSGSSYPFGSCGVERFDGTRIAHYHCDWLGDYGRKNTWAKEHIHFWNNTKRFTIKKRFSMEELENFDPRKKVMIHGIKAFVAKINIDSDFTTKEGLVELYTA